MKILTRSYDSPVLVPLQNEEFLSNQRIAGKVVSDALNILNCYVLEYTNKTMLELDSIIETFIRDHSCYPTFKGYNGFPNACTISINEDLVHGIPSTRRLMDGDLVSFDLGATYNGAIADAAITCIYGQPKYSWHVKLIESTKEALTRAIDSISIGKKIGCIGETIYKCARNNGFRVIESYGGHCISKDTLHNLPFINNKSSSDVGIRIQKGMVIAIEPMLVLTDITTNVRGDGWTVFTKEVNAHFEHTVYVHNNNKIEVVTATTI